MTINNHESDNILQLIEDLKKGQIEPHELEDTVHICQIEVSAAINILSSDFQENSVSIFQKEF